MLESRRQPKSKAKEKGKRKSVAYWSVVIGLEWDI